jgi:hypothetical protein
VAAQVGAGDIDDLKHHGVVTGYVASSTTP